MEQVSIEVTLDPEIVIYIKNKADSSNQSIDEVINNIVKNAALDEFKTTVTIPTVIPTTMPYTYPYSDRTGPYSDAHKTIKISDDNQNKSWYTSVTSKIITSN